MKPPNAIKTLFVDIGGVLLTNGWDHLSRQAAAKTFHLDWEEMDERHRLSFDTFELGKLTLEEYLDRVVFDRPRKFTRAQFRRFMFAQSQPFSDMLGLVRELKARHRLKVIVVSNEGREINAHRIRTFKLAEFVDAFVSSCFVQLRTPDVEIFRLALDLAQTPAKELVTWRTPRSSSKWRRSWAFAASCTPITTARGQSWLRWAWTVSAHWAD